MQRHIGTFTQHAQKPPTQQTIPISIAASSYQSASPTTKPTMNPLVQHTSHPSIGADNLTEHEHVNLETSSLSDHGFINPITQHRPNASNRHLKRPSRAHTRLANPSVRKTIHPPSCQITYQKTSRTTSHKSANLSRVGGVVGRWLGNA